MTHSRLFRLTAATLMVAGVLLLVPDRADAQRRRAVRVVRSRPAVSVGLYVGPRLYRPIYTNPYLYGPYFYGGFYRPWPGWYGPGPYYGGVYDVGSSLRLQVRPREAEVYVDGYYAGVVDSFDGVFQRLHVEAGEHDLEIHLPGHRPFRQRVYLQPGRTFDVRHTMEPLAPGEPEPARPAAPTRQPRRQSTPGPDVSRLPGREAPATPLPADAAPVDAFGSLAVRVQPAGATVTIDGEPWEGAEENERLIVQVGAGVHVVEISLQGYRTYLTEITVDPGETETLNVALTPN